MSRINIIQQDQEAHDTPGLSSYDGQKVVGWFDDSKATKYAEATRWNGSNPVSLATGTQTEHEALYHTSSGRWVLNRWSQYQGVRETYVFVSDEDAADWLRLNEEDASLATGVADEPERGPGRPEVGPAINIRLPQELLDHVDEYARGLGVSRASAIRALLTEAFLG